MENESVTSQKCKLCQERFRDEPSLIIHFKQIHFTSSGDTSADSENDESEEEEEEKCDFNNPTAFITAYEKNLLCESALRLFPEIEEGLGIIDNETEYHIPKADLNPVNFLTDLECYLLYSSYHVAEAEGLFDQRQEAGLHAESVRDVLNQSLPSDVGLGRGHLMCKICKKYFTSRRSLIRHNRIHTGKNLYKCSECQKVFTQKSHLEAHMLVHAQAPTKDFKCDQCEKQFTRKSALNRHVRLDNPILMAIYHDVDPFWCRICTKRFTSPGAFEKHNEIHSKAAKKKRLKCSQCHMTFIYKARLEQHMMRGHSNEKNFKCDQCDKRFARHYDLTRHMKCHSGIKPYFCKLCNKRFTRNDNLQIHIKCSHKEESRRQSD